MTTTADTTAESSPNPGLAAKWVSEILWPPWVVIALVAVSGLAAADLPLPQQVGWGLLACLFSGLLPFGVGTLAIRRGRLPGRHLPDRRDRIKPMAWTVASVLAGQAVLLLLGAPREVVAVQAAMLSGAVTILALTAWRKVSMHTGVVASAVVLLVLLFGPWWLLAAPLVPLVAWSRVRLGNHTPFETVVGAIAGALSAWPAVLILAAG